MRITVLGSGGPVPYSNRSSTSVLAELDGRHFLVDCGPGAGLRLSQAGVQPGQIEAILLTHLHMDHCHELPAIAFGAMLSGKTRNLSVYAPAGIRDLHSLFFEKAYPYLVPLAKQVTSSEMQLSYHDLSEGAVMAWNGFAIAAKRVQHGNMETYGFRLSSRSGALTISGDTVACPAVIDLAKGSHTLIQDCALPDAFAGNPIHATPTDVARIAHESGVKRVVLTHMLPECKGKEEEMLASVRRGYAGEVLLGEDLMVLEV